MRIPLTLLRLAAVSCCAGTISLHLSAAQACVADPFDLLMERCERESQDRRLACFGHEDPVIQRLCFETNVGATLRCQNEAYRASIRCLPGNLNAGESSGRTTHKVARIPFERSFSNHNVQVLTVRTFHITLFRSEIS